MCFFVIDILTRLFLKKKLCKWYFFLALHPIQFYSIHRKFAFTVLCKKQNQTYYWGKHTATAVLVCFGFGGFFK